MHLALKKTTLAAIAPFALLSCQDRGIVAQIVPVKTEPMEFMGENVMVPADFPKELFNAVWTCFAIRQIILGAAVGEDNALTFVRTATSKHELKKL